MSPLAVYVSRRPLACDMCCAPLDAGSWMHRNEARRFVCLACAGLDQHVFVEAGDPALTRRAARESEVAAVVLIWNGRRGRYDRHGVLVERGALRYAEWSCRMDEDSRARRREIADARRRAANAAFVRALAARIRADFPRCPPEREREIAEYACADRTARVRRRLKKLNRGSSFAAVSAYVRHKETRYEALLAAGRKGFWARKEVQPDVLAVLASWRG